MFDLCNDEAGPNPKGSSASDEEHFSQCQSNDDDRNLEHENNVSGREDDTNNKRIPEISNGNFRSNRN